MVINYGFNFGPVKADAQIVDLATAKQNSRIDFNDEDALLQIFVDAAAAEMEKYIAAPILEREGAQLYLSEFKNFKFPFPVKSIVNITYLDADFNIATMPAADYMLYENTLVFKKEQPDNAQLPLNIKFKAGYTNAEMPADIKRAALLIFGAAEVYRENMPVKMDSSAKAILRPYRVQY